MKMTAKQNYTARQSTDVPKHRANERDYLRENCTVAGLNLHRVPIRKTRAPPKLSKSLDFPERIKVISLLFAETESDAIYRDMDTSMFKKTKDMTPNQTDGGQKFATTRLSLLMTTTHTWWRCRSCLRRTPRTPRYQCWCLCWYRCCEILSAKCPG